MAAVVTVALHKVLAGRSVLAGRVNVAIWLTATYVTVPPLIEVPVGQARVKLPAFRLAVSIGLLNVAVMVFVLTAKPVVLGKGVIAVTASGVLLGTTGTRETTGAMLPAPRMGD